MDQNESYNSLMDDDVLAETRFRVVQIMRHMFWEKFDHSQLSTQVRNFLISKFNSFSLVD